MKDENAVRSAGGFRVSDDIGPQIVYGIAMSLTELKEQAAALPPEEQAELAAYLAERLRRDDPAYRKGLRKRIDDRDPKNWVRWSQVKSESESGD